MFRVRVCALTESHSSSLLPPPRLLPHLPHESDAPPTAPQHVDQPSRASGSCSTLSAPRRPAFLSMRQDPPCLRRNHWLGDQTLVRTRGEALPARSTSTGATRPTSPADQTTVHLESALAYRSARARDVRDPPPICVSRCGRAPTERGRSRIRE